MSDYDAMEIPEYKNERQTGLENRYFVLKHKDVQKYLNKTEIEILMALANKVDSLRGGPVKGLVLESDWPEFQPAQKSLLERINANR